MPLWGGRIGLATVRSDRLRPSCRAPRDGAPHRHCRRRGAEAMRQHCHGGDSGVLSEAAQPSAFAREPGRKDGTRRADPRSNLQVKWALGVLTRSDRRTAPRLTGFGVRVPGGAPGLQVTSPAPWAGLFCYPRLPCESGGPW